MSRRCTNALVHARFSAMLCCSCLCALASPVTQSYSQCEPPSWFGGGISRHVSSICRITVCGPRSLAGSQTRTVTAAASATDRPHLRESIAVSEVSMGGVVAGVWNEKSSDRRVGGGEGQSGRSALSPRALHSMIYIIHLAILLSRYAELVGVIVHWWHILQADIPGLRVLRWANVHLKAVLDIA